MFHTIGNRKSALDNLFQPATAILPNASSSSSHA
jgi:hypothetical protein